MIYKFSGKKRRIRGANFRGYLSWQKSSCTGVKFRENYQN